MLEYAFYIVEENIFEIIHQEHRHFLIREHNVNLYKLVFQVLL